MNVDLANIMERMERALWGVAYGVYANEAGLPTRQREAPATPSAAKRAAADLVKLYVKLNDAALLDMYSRWQAAMIDAGRRGDPEAAEDAGPRRFGRMVAMAALGLMRQAIFENLFVIPSFEVEYDGKELRWEGGSSQTSKYSDEETFGRGRVQRRNPRAPHDVPHVKTIAETRRILAKVTPCDPKCPGWGIFNEHEGRPEIQVCDECMTSVNKALRLSDDDVAQLAEAQKALREAQARVLEENPRTRNVPSGQRAQTVRGPNGERVRVGDHVVVPADREHGVRGGPGVVTKVMPGKSWDIVVKTKDDEYEMNAMRLQSVAAANPVGILTDKGERMYEEIKAGYKGDPRASEIAMRTVYARAREGVPGLLRTGQGRPPGVPNGSR